MTICAWCGGDKLKVYSVRRRRFLKTRYLRCTACGRTQPRKQIVEERIMGGDKPAGLAPGQNPP